VTPERLRRYLLWSLPRRTSPGLIDSFPYTGPSKRTISTESDRPKSSIGKAAPPAHSTSARASAKRASVRSPRQRTGGLSAPGARGLRVGARRGDDEQEQAEQDSPQGHPIRPAHRAFARASRGTSAIDLDHPGAPSICGLTPNRHRASHRQRRTRSLAGGLGRTRPSLCLWHLAVLFRRLTGLADGLAPKERRYGQTPD
jgi:hypothetical protein